MKKTFLYLLLFALTDIKPLFAQTLTRSPYLQMLGTTSVVIRWQTNTACNSKVAYGTTLSYGSVVTDAASVTEHEIKIQSLLPNTKYFYQIGTTTLVLQGDANNWVKTAIPLGSTDFTVWVTGDFGSGSTGQTAVRDSYISYVGANTANFWIWLGDNAYSSGFASEYNSYVFGVYPQIMKNLPIFPALGNHDYSQSGYHSATSLGTAFEYFNAFTMPTNAELGGVASTTEKYYSYNFGNAHFIVLDSYGSFNNSGSAMYQWLQSDLAANTQKWTVCYFHHPPYSKGTHNSDTETELMDMRQNIVPLLEQYNVDLVLSGHSHTYERSFLLKGHFGLENTLTPSMKINATTGNVTPFYKKNIPSGTGTVYAVCGVSGQGGTTSTSAGYPHDAMVTSHNTFYGSMLLTFKADTLSAKFLTSTGTIQDSFKIVKKNCINAATLAESQLSGNWNDVNTWDCTVVPTSVTNVTVNQGHTINVNGTSNQALSLSLKGIINYLSGGALRIGN
jgi:acid phosphatase type 7